jgi:hypothetical protein
VGQEVKRRIGGHLNGVVYGALAGAAVVALGFSTVMIVSSPPPPFSELWYSIGNLLVFSTYAAFAGFLAFALGLLLVGLPAQLGLRRTRLDNPFAATIAGGLLSGVAALALLFRGDLQSLSWVSITVVAGGLSGLAYFRTSGHQS